MFYAVGNLHIAVATVQMKASTVSQRQHNHFGCDRSTNQCRSPLTRYRRCIRSHVTFQSSSSIAFCFTLAIAILIKQQNLEYANAKATDVIYHLQDAGGLPESCTTSRSSVGAAKRFNNCRA